MPKPNSQKTFDRVGEFYRDGSYYTLQEFAHKLGMPIKTIRNKFVYPGLLKVCQLARGYEVVPGYEECKRHGGVGRLLVKEGGAR